MRFSVGVEYDGSQYHGWQKQKAPVLATVQEQVEKAFSKVADHPIDIICAGRTDRGVHATGQVLHFDSHADRSEYAWLCGVNSILPRDIRISWIKPISTEFHARFSALKRRYHYWVYNHSTRPAILNAKVTWHMQKLDVNAMQAASQYLLGEHDFTSFRAIACQANTPVRTMHELNIEQHGDYIKIDLCANAFLHHMVRNIVGVLLAIGENKQPVDWMLEVLQARDRSKGGVTAPPDGLYLVDISYPTEFEISSQEAICYNAAGLNKGELL